MTDLSFFVSIMMKRVLLVVAAALLACGCHHAERPADVMDADQMVAFLFEAYQLEGFYAVETQYRYDAVSDAVLRRYDSILEAQGLTRQDVERSFDYYSAHPDLYSAIQDSVVARLEAL